jgi:SAM-dependent methyltransferase
VLLASFQLLYGRLVALHERAGRLLFGAAWQARRELVLPVAGAPDAVVLDIGCGEGRLLARAKRHGWNAIGVDPSREMTRRARRRRLHVVRADARRLPLPNERVAWVCCTYPGPWIADSRTWDELARVTLPGATVRILLGGTYERGRGSRVRKRLASIAYGRSASSAIGEATAGLGHPLIVGRLERVDDRWGVALLWCGMRVELGSRAGSAS